VAGTDLFGEPLFLTVASRSAAAFALLVVGALWRERRRRRLPEERSLIAPVATAIAVTSIFLLALFVGGFLLVAFTAVIGLLAAYEYGRMTNLAREYVVALALWIIAGLSIATVASVQLLLVLPLGLFLTTTLIPLFSGRVEGAHRQVSSVIFGYLYIGLPLAYLVFIRSDVTWGLRFLLAVCAGVWISDTLGYIVGSKVRGPRLAPTVSPGKTWSGAAGSVLGTTIAVPLMQLTIPLGFPLAELFPLAACTAVCAIWSDLIESFVKRDFKLKDAGSVLPGFGGVLDRFDSLLVTIPITYYVMLGLRHLVH
jgi:phosphatidate cytidylyltransferase